MLWAGENNVLQESVEEKNHHVKQWEFSHTTLHLTLQTATQLKQKHQNVILKIKNSKLTFQSLIIEVGHQPKWWVKYPKYSLHLASYTPPPKWFAYQMVKINKRRGKYQKTEMDE